MSLSLPPLLRDIATDGDPAATARHQARAGCDAGLMCWRVSADRADAALVFAPEVPLHEAMVMLPLCGVGIQNALGALAPPEVAVHLDWAGGVFVNGGRCGGLRVLLPDSASETDVPGWLIVALSLRLRMALDAPGEARDDTALGEEGCGGIAAPDLLAAWARHTLVWIRRWEDEGPAPLHAEWSGLLRDIGGTVTRGHGTGEVMSDQQGTFIGTDETFGMLLRCDGTTRRVPLSTLRERET